MWETISSPLPVPFNFVVILVLLIISGSVIGVIAKYIRDYAVYRQELDFKRDMLDRGLGAEEIEQIVRASGVEMSADAEE